MQNCVPSPPLPLIRTGSYQWGDTLTTLQSAAPAVTPQRRSTTAQFVEIVGAYDTVIYMVAAGRQYISIRNGFTGHVDAEPPPEGQLPQVDWGFVLFQVMRPGTCTVETPIYRICVEALKNDNWESVRLPKASSGRGAEPLIGTSVEEAC